MNIFDAVIKLERMIRNGILLPRYGVVTKVDLTGTAEWNPRKFKPSVLCNIQDKGEVKSMPCRVKTPWGKNDEGVWFPPEVGMRAHLSFPAGIKSTPQVESYVWAGKGEGPPTEAGEKKALIKYGKHLFIMNKNTEGGIFLETEHGIKLSMSEGQAGNSVKLEHPLGSYIEIDVAGKLKIYSKGDIDLTAIGNLFATIGGNLTANVTGNISATAGGNVSVIAGGTSLISSQGVNEIRSATEVLLKTASEVAGILTSATHPVCMLMGTPNGASGTVKGSS